MQKVSHYRRAMWPTEGRSVEQLIRRALLNAPAVSDTKFRYQGDVSAQITARDPQPNSVGLYFTLFSEVEQQGQLKTVVPGSVEQALLPVRSFLKQGSTW